MKKKILFGCLLFGTLSLAMIGCDKNNDVSMPAPGNKELLGDGPGGSEEEECAADYTAPIAAVTGPSTGQVGQPIVLNIDLVGANLCAVSGSVTATGSGTSLALSGSVHYVGCMCAQALETISTTFSFTPVQPGTYNFSYLDENQQSQVFTVVVP